MTSDELKIVGEIAYGFGWQTKLAADVGVSARTMRRYVSGRYKVPEYVAFHVMQEVYKRTGILSDLLNRAGIKHA